MRGDRRGKQNKLENGGPTAAAEPAELAEPAEEAEEAEEAEATEATEASEKTVSHEAEFREYMVSRWGGLVRFAYGLTGDRGHAEDLAQTALARAYASWPRVRRAEDPDAYVRRILINANHRRFRRQRVAEHPGEAPREPAVTDGTAMFDQREVLMAALMELPPKQRAVVVLRYWDGLTETQAAQVLGCSVGTVKSQASRALAKLRTSAQLQDGRVVS